MKRPLVNLFSVLSGDLGSRLIGFFISIYLARVLEPDGFGLMSLGFAVLGYLQLAGSPGIQVLEARNAAAFAVVDTKRVNAVLTLRLVLATGLWMLAAGCTWVFVTDDVARDVILLFALSLFPLALMVDWFFQGKEAYLAVAISRVLQYGVYGGLVFLLVHNAGDVHFVAIAFGGGALVGAIVLWRAYEHRWGAFDLRWLPAMWKEILLKGIPVGTAMFLAQSVTNLPPLVIGYFSSAGDVGLFSAAMKIVFLLMLVDRLFNTIFLPVATRYFSSHFEELDKLVQTTVRIVLIVVIPLSIAGVILGREMIAGVFGGRYEGASPLLAILMAYFALTALNSVFICVLIGSGHEKEYTKRVTWGSVGLCVSVVCGTALFGTHGAAYGVVLGELMTVVLMIPPTNKLVHLSLANILVRPAVAGVCMVGTAFSLREMSSFVIAVISLLVFVAVVALLKGITAREIQFLRERFV